MLSLCVLGASLIVASVCRLYIGNPPEDTKAGIPGISGVLTLAVLAYQVWVNQQQWEAMREQQQIMEATLSHAQRVFEMTERPLSS